MKTIARAEESAFPTTQVALTAMALAVAATMSPQVQAQRSDPGLVLEEIIVTARKREESIQDVPVSVTSIGKELKEASLRRLEDIQSFTPNVYIRNTSTIPGGAAISIRGVSYQETDKSYDPSIGVVMEGVYLGTSSGSLLQNFDIARMEVLRGPQGTLFGKNTTGGVINVIRGDVTMDWGADLSITLGEDGREDYKAVVNAPIVDDILGIKLFGYDINSDGYMRNTTLGEDVGGDDMVTYGFATQWEATDELSIKFHYEHNENDTDTGAWTTFNQPGDLGCAFSGIPIFWENGCQGDPGSDEDRVSDNQRNFNNSEYDTYIGTINWDLDSFLITSITGYREMDEAYMASFDAMPGDLLFIDYDNQWDQFSQELRLTSQFSDKFEFVAGLYYWDVEYEQRWDVGHLQYFLDFSGLQAADPPGSLTPTNLNYNGQNQDTTSYAAFFSGDYYLNEKWTIIAGLRWTYEEKDFEGAFVGINYDPAAGDLPPALDFRKFDDDWDEVSPKIGFTYDYNDDIMIFGSYTEGFKSGGFIGRQAEFPDGFDPSYDPETVDNWELGMKSTWMDGRIIFNPTIFFSNYDDKQEDLLVPIGLSNVASVVANASTLEIFGVEMEFQMQVTEEWNVRASYGYLDSEYDDYMADVNGDGIVTDNSDRTPRNTPENTFGLSTTYTVQVGPGDLQTFAAYRWRDDIEVIADNDPLGSLDSIDNLDINLSYIWADGRYRVTAYGRNVTDEREATVVRITPLVTFANYSEGETYGVEFAASF